MIRVLAVWPDHAFDSAAEARQYVERALSDMSKALGVNEPQVLVVHPDHLKYRDAESGEYVTREYAEEHPDTTVGES